MGRFNIEEFRSRVDRNRGFAKPSRFFVSLVAPLAIPGANIVRDNVEFYCEASNLPGYQLQTQDYARYTYGPMEKRVFAPHFNPLQLTIMADGSGLLWEFFNAWASYIMPHTLKRGITGTDTKYGGAPYELKYREKYITDVSIYHLPETYNDDNIQQDNPSQFDKYICRTICRDCFPSQISDMQLAWGDRSNISRFQVQLEYVDWHNERELS